MAGQSLNYFCSTKREIFPQVEVRDSYSWGIRTLPILFKSSIYHSESQSIIKSLYPQSKEYLRGRLVEGLLQEEINISILWHTYKGCEWKLFFPKFSPKIRVSIWGTSIRSIKFSGGPSFPGGDRGRDALPDDGLVRRLLEVDQHAQGDLGQEDAEQEEEELRKWREREEGERNIYDRDSLSVNALSQHYNYMKAKRYQRPE